MSIVDAVRSFFIGGAVYVALELLWRRRSHISMFVAGGIAFLLLSGLFLRYDMGYAGRFIISMLIITAVEFVTGIIVNVHLRLNVWDYSAVRPNLYGQVCLKYSLLWGSLSIPAWLLTQALFL